MTNPSDNKGCLDSCGQTTCWTFRFRNKQCGEVPRKPDTIYYTHNA